MAVFYRITPLEPLVSRDARPVRAIGGRVHSLEWLSQSVLAGTVRTALYKEDRNRTPAVLKSVTVQGGFLISDGRLYFPVPLDFVLSKDGSRTTVHQIKPMPKEEIPEMSYTNLPFGDMALCGIYPGGQFKPEKREAFWSAEKMAQWLLNGRDGFDSAGGTRGPMVKDERVHVALDPKTGTGVDGMVFSTTALDFVTEHANRFDCSAISVAVDFASLKALPDRFVAPVGGGRHLAEFSRADDDQTLWGCPQGIVLGKKLRMVLASPALFKGGWKPGWIGEDRTGVIPGTDVKVRLVSVVNGRWQPVSGWSYEKVSWGAKALRRAVPAGSVYFFEVLEGNFDVAERWLKPVSDEMQDCLDGFGLALWGNW
ncbi:MAG: type III-B CRISPR module-associated protein Cmr3 [Pyramidobacter sp.]|jgi:CRISPR-associated protein Cmr3